MLGIPASRKRWIFWLACENSVISDVDSPSAIFLPDDAAVRWHKHRNRVGEQKQLRCGIACGGIDLAAAQARLLEIYSLHELEKRDVSVESHGQNHCWKRNSSKCRKRLGTEAGESKVE